MTKYIITYSNQTSQITFLITSCKSSCGNDYLSPIDSERMTTTAKKKKTDANLTAEAIATAALVAVATILDGWCGLNELLMMSINKKKGWRFLFCTDVSSLAYNNLVDSSLSFVVVVVAVVVETREETTLFLLTRTLNVDSPLTKLIS